MSTLSHLNYSLKNKLTVPDRDAPSFITPLSTIICYARPMKWSNLNLGGIYNSDAKMQLT